jgi:hypothetical protein
MPRRERPLYEETHLDTADDLLDEISVHRGRLWEVPGADTDWDWIYRGQSDAAWTLKPTAFRPGMLGTLGFDKTDPRTGQQQRDREEDLVIEFVSRVDAEGLHVPGDRPELRDKDLAHEKNEATCFPRVERRGMYALAQHHGIPTRLLDWSHSASVAAYFACVGVASCSPRQPSSERFAVWALSRRFVDEIACRWEPFISIVTAPRATNPNLKAQQGIFTLGGFRSDPPEDVHPPDLDATFRSKTHTDEPRDGGAFFPGPVLRKFTVPSAEARILLRDLAMQGVSASSIYPGLAGVVQAMREREWHQVPHRRYRAT